MGFLLDRCEAYLKSKRCHRIDGEMIFWDDTGKNRVTRVTWNITQQNKENRRSNEYVCLIIPASSVSCDTASAGPCQCKNEASCQYQDNLAKKKYPAYE